MYHPVEISTAETVARDPEAAWTLQKKLSLYRDSKPYLPAVSPYGSHGRIAPPPLHITVTIQFSLPAVTRNELAWDVKILGGSNMTGTDLYVNKPHCAAAVRP